MTTPKLNAWNNLRVSSNNCCVLAARVTAIQNHPNVKYIRLDPLCHELKQTVKSQIPGASSLYYRMILADRVIEVLDNLLR